MLVRLLSGPLALCVLAATFLATSAGLPSVARAQDDGGFVFDDEEVEEFGEPMDFGEDDVDDWGDDGWGDDGWGDDPLEPEPAAATNTVTALMVPGDTLAPQLADFLTEALLREVGALEGYEVVSNQGLRDEFEIMGAELALECAFDPICLGRYGRQLGISRIVIGRVGPAEGGMWGTTIDLVETDGSAITNYRYFETEGRAVAVDEALAPQVRQLFGIREARPDAVVGRTGPSVGQKVAAWSTAGLALGAVGAGIAFGLQARGIQSDLEGCDVVTAYDGEDVCDLTQVDGQAEIDDGKSAALLSNVFIGTGLMLGVVSTVLFTVTPGGDIDESAQVDRPRALRVTPAVGRQSFGLSGSLSF